MATSSIEDLIAAFARLPGIGRKTAQRLAFYIIKSQRQEADTLARALVNVKEQIHHCVRCFNFTDRGSELCEVCRNPRRDQQLVFVVEEASDVLILENAQLVQGVYHVLGGVLSPLDGVHPEHLHITQLLERVRTDQVGEVVLALNASVEGDTTSDYIARQLEGTTKVTGLARGLPVGADLDLADKVTLAHALAGRHSF
jgi:recombination protein RecR